MAVLRDIKIKSLKGEQPLTVKIVLSKPFKIRLWAATKFFLIAGKLLGCGANIEVST